MTTLGPKRSVSHLEEIVTIKREVPQPIRDLVLFVKYLAESNTQTVDIKTMTDSTLIAHARQFYEREHGDD